MEPAQFPSEEHRLVLLRHVASFTEPGYAEFILPDLDEIIRDYAAEAKKRINARDKTGVRERGRPRNTAREDFVFSIAACLPPCTTRKQLFTTVALALDFAQFPVPSRVDEMVDDYFRYCDGPTVMQETVAELWRLNRSPGR
jgi:hypothetical protein